MSNLQLGLLLDSADLQLWRPLLQDAVIMVLPKLLGSILSAHALQNPGATWVLVYKIRQVVHGAVDDDVQPVLDFVVRRNFFDGEGLGHYEW